MIVFLNVILYFTLLASFLSFVILYLIFEREALRTPFGRSILLFFGVFALSMTFFTFSYFVDFPGKLYIRLLMYFALNVVGWGPTVLLLKSHLKGWRNARN